MELFTFEWGYTWSMENTYQCYASNKEEAEKFLFFNNPLDRGDFWRLID